MNFASLLNKYTSTARTPKSNTSIKTSESVVSSFDINDRETKRQKLDQNTKSNNITGIYFSCNEGSVTHYYHFLFGALVPLIEYHLESNKPSSPLAYCIKTDVGPMKRLLTELPLNITELYGPPAIQLDFDASKPAHDDKCMYSGLVLKPGEVLLPAYDIFNGKFFNDSYVPKVNSVSFVFIMTL